MKRYIAFVFRDITDTQHGWDNVVRKKNGQVASWETKRSAEKTARKEMRGDLGMEAHVVDLQTGELVYRLG